ncbi:ABC transporter ATP-binding protein [Carnobacteriaceae bacterium zg-ZUI252]|nr:ABC transporter ATP-binding protein [Carnobacteriaceae bacterium zg-ZUI252]QTU82744.1 ABC transporter ATP-binding protein [Carnobacteriaceae bacterium zg-C25]
MLEVKGLHKTFGELVANNNVSFTVKEGEILGLIGQNGAGKSTIFRLILDFILKDKGEVLWKGKPLGKDAYDEIGYLPEERGLNVKMTIEEQLLYFALLKGKSKKEISPKIDEWLELFQVKGKRKDKIKTLSKGNQQKVQVIATLIHEPKLVILDEPFSGLDPVNAELLKQGILNLKAKGSAVIFSSHNMENVSELCDTLLMMHHGDPVLYGTIQDVRESFGRTRLFLECDTPIEAIQNVTGVLSVSPAKHSGVNVLLENEAVGHDLYDLVTKNGYIYAFSQQPPTLDEIFKLKVGERHV